MVFSHLPPASHGHDFGNFTALGSFSFIRALLDELFHVLLLPSL